MRIHIENLGVVKSADIEVGDLTIICGENNTGKTYISYSLFGFLDYIWDTKLLSISPTNVNTLQAFTSEKLLHQYRPFLHTIFASTEALFQSAEFVVSVEADIEKYKVKLNSDVIDTIKLFFPNPYCFTADRGGIMTLWGFYDLPDDPWQARWKNKNDNNTRKNGEPPVPLPVRRNLDFYRQLRNGNYINTGTLCKTRPDILAYFQKILGGDFSFVNGIPVFKPENYADSELRMSESSSSVRALFLLGNYLRYVAAPGDLLMIDEPELNLHPEKQRQLAKLFVMIVNAGIKVFITTHSPYILTPLNNLLYASALSQDKEKHNAVAGIIESECWLNANRVQCYYFTDKVESIMDAETNMIDLSKLDAASSLVNEEYDKLSEIEYQ